MAMLNNQRVNPSKSLANSHPRPSHRWHLRAESPVRPSSRHRSGPGSDALTAWSKPGNGQEPPRSWEKQHVSNSNKSASWWNQEKTLPLFTAWRASIFQISGLFYWMCYLDTLRDSDRPTWWAYYIHTFIYVYLYIYISLQILNSKT